MMWTSLSMRWAARTCACVACVSWFVAGYAHAESTQAQPTNAGLVLEGLQDTLSILDKHQLPFDPSEARRNVVEALIRSSDQNAYLVDKQQALALEKDRRGMVVDAGLRVSMSNGMARVVQVVDEGPAALAGVKVDDLIQVIGEEAIVAKDVLSVSDMLRGSEGDVVSFVVKREGDQQPIELELALQARQLDAVSEMRELPADLCYARVNGMFPGCGEIVAGTMRKWAEVGKFGVVLDLRRAAGDDLGSVAAIANLFSEPNTLLFSLRDVADNDVEAVRSEPGAALGMPLLVLVDERTAGASEVLAATLRGSGKGAILVGRPTAGDPEIRTRIRLADGEWAYVATRRLVTADGTTYDGSIGVQPDMLVDIDSENYREYIPDRPLLTDPRQTTDEEREANRLKEAIRGDTGLIRAVDVLLGLKALNIRGYGYAQGIGH